MVGTLAGDGDAEFLDGIEGDGEGGEEAAVGGGGPGRLIVVDVDAIEGDVVLIAAGADDFSGGGDAGLEAEEFDDVAGLEGELADLHFRESVAEGGVLGIDYRRLAHDVDRLSDLADFELDIDGEGNVDLEAELVGGGTEAGHLGFEGVVAGGDLVKDVVSGGGGNRLTRGRGIRVCKRNDGSGDDAILVVADDTGEGTRLGEEGEAESQSQ